MRPNPPTARRRIGTSHRQRTAWLGYVTFDCYGTLIHFDMNGAARRIYGAMLDDTAMARFNRDFAAYPNPWRQFPRPSVWWRAIRPS